MAINNLTSNLQLLRLPVLLQLILLVFSGTVVDKVLCQTQSSVNVITVAGSGQYVWQDGQGTYASFMGPYGVIVDRTSNTVLVSDYGSRVLRRIIFSPASVATVSSVAGSGTSAVVDGTGIGASFKQPASISSVLPGGRVFVADGAFGVVRIVTLSTGAVSSVGSGMLLPMGVAADDSSQTATVFIADTYNHCVKKMTEQGGVGGGWQVSTLAGGSGVLGWIDGQATAARFNYPQGLSYDSVAAVIYVSDTQNSRVRTVSPVTGRVGTLSGSGAMGYGDGQATTASFNTMNGVAVSLGGAYLYVADSENHRIRKVVTATGYVVTLAGTGVTGLGQFPNGHGTVARFYYPYGVAVDAVGDVYVADYGTQSVRKIVICPADRYLDPTSKVCVCRPGTVENLDYGSGNINSIIVGVATCLPCATGRYLAAGMQSCDYCPVGKEPTADKTSCDFCLLGRYRSNPSSAACIDCAIGTESSADRTSCSSCAAGFYRPSLTNMQCIACPLYATCSSSAIVSCSAGFKVNANLDGCERCPVGQQSSADGRSCTACPAGQVRPNLMLDTCVSCPGNGTCPSANTVSCNNGYFYAGGPVCAASQTVSLVTQTQTQYATVTPAVVTQTQYATATVTPAALSFTSTSAVTSTLTSSTTITNTAGPATVTVSFGAGATTVTQIITATQGPSGSAAQVQNANSVTVDFIGTLPISPLIFGLACVGGGAFIMLILASVCCWRPSRKHVQDDLYGPSLTLSTMKGSGPTTFRNDPTLV